MTTFSDRMQSCKTEELFEKDIRRCYLNYGYKIGKILFHFKNFVKNLKTFFLFHPAKIQLLQAKIRLCQPGLSW